jgi:hypothetical protein
MLRRAIAVVLPIAGGLLLASTMAGCATNRMQFEQRSIVQHYEAMRKQLKTKERSGAEGGCPTCVY